MTKVVLDTSVLVSAFLKPGGVNALILQKGQNEFELCLSEEILEETGLALLTYDRIRKKHTLPTRTARAYNLKEILSTEQRNLRG